MGDATQAKTGNIYLKIKNYQQRNENKKGIKKSSKSNLHKLRTVLFNLKKICVSIQNVYS